MTKNLSCESVSGEEEFWAEAGGVVREDEPRTEPPVYDLEERTARFGEAVIEFAKKIPRGSLTNRLIEQIVGCSSSIGANYCEADDAVSKKEFFLRIGTCRKEARETKHFLRMIVCAVPELKPRSRILWLEAKELNLIFAKIYRSKEGK